MDDLLDVAAPAQPLEQFLGGDEGGDRPVAQVAPAAIRAEAVADENILDARSLSDATTFDPMKPAAPVTTIILHPPHPGRPGHGTDWPSRSPESTEPRRVSWAVCLGSGSRGLPQRWV